MLSEEKSGLKIAIVDDQPELLTTFSRALQALGYPEPSIFPNGTSIVRALMTNQEHFDVILMDYRMPEMNGIEAAKLIKRYRKDAKIVIMTGYDFVKEKAAEIGVPFLQKPFKLEQLVQCLDTIK